jgi:hypothetical protein
MWVPRPGDDEGPLVLKGFLKVAKGAVSGILKDILDGMVY